MLSISKNYTKNTNHLPFNVFFKQTHLATPKKKKSHYNKKWENYCFYNRHFKHD